MKLFDFSKERIPFYISLVAVLALGCIYYFMYLPKNEAEINLWKFRTLQKIDRNMQTKIEIGQKQLNTYLKSIEKGTAYTLLNKFLKSQHTTNFPIGEITREPITDASSKANKSSLEFNVSGKTLVLTQEKKIGRFLYKLSLNYKFENFIKPLLSKDVFDHYIVVGDSTILFETFPSGLDVDRDSSLMKKGNLVGATIIDREYGGVSYKLFVQPVKLKNNTSIRVVGLLTNDHFYHKKTRLPPRYVLFLVIIFACIIITFPIVKLYQLADEDRLTLSDALSIVIVCMFLMSMLFLVFIKYSHRIVPDDQKSKRALSSSIKEGFLKEIGDNYATLILLDSLRRQPGYNFNFYGINRANSNNIVKKKIIDSLVKDVDLGRVFWLNNLGIEKRTWNSSSINGLVDGDFSGRDYFKKIINGQSYEYQNNSNKKFFSEPIVSLISGNLRTNISIPSKFNSARVAVISFKIKSLNQAKVPPGYTFAMINDAGEVLYHSDTTKSLNENLFDEFSDSGSLKYSIKTNSSEPFNTQYYGKEYSALVSPVGDVLPYHLVILENLAFEEYRDVNVFSFTISMQLMIFMLVLVQILIMFFASAKRSLYKNKIFETDWIGPKESSNWEYINSTGFNLTVFVGLCFIRNEPFLSTIFMVLSCITSIPIFLNLLFVQKNLGKKPESRWYKAKAGAMGSIVLLILNVVAFGVLDESWRRFLFFELCWILYPALLFLIIHKRLQSAGNRENFFTKNISFNKSYTAVLFSWMLVAMGLPILIFFRASYNYDQHIIARYNQANLAKNAIFDIRSKYNENERGKIFYNPSLEDKLRDYIYKDSQFISDIYIECDTNVYRASIDLQNLECKEDSIAINLFQAFHFYSGESMLDSINLNRSSSGTAHFNGLMKQVVIPTDSTVTHNRFNGKYLRLSSAPLNFHRPLFSKIPGIFWWLSFPLSLLALFFVLYGLINKIFSIKKDAEHSDTFNEAHLMNMLLGNNIFLVGFIGIGKYKLIDYFADASKMPEIERTIFDFSQMLDVNVELIKVKWDKLIEESCKDKYKLVILSNFDYNYMNVKASQFKLSFLENLLNKTSKTKILIQSTVHPNAILGVLCSSGEKSNDIQTAERWHNAIGKLRIELSPVSRERTLAMLKIEPGQGKEDGFIYESLVSYYHFYFSIWQSLTKEEKFFMYDLAEDGLVNCYDKYTLSLLVNKGLIVYKNGRLRLFTKGFRNFIIAGLGEIEMEKLIEKINDNRHWNKTRLPLIIILMAILIFILSSQHETSTKLITTLGALSAAIPALISFLSTLGGVNSAKK